MTRGTFILLENERIQKSVEFNGDMYPGGHYEEAVELLDTVFTTEDFKEIVKKFNSNNHQYGDKLILDYETYSDSNFYGINYELINFDENYFECFFSDYLYLRNISNRNFRIILASDFKDIVILPPNKTMVFNFGRRVKEYPEQYSLD